LVFGQWKYMADTSTITKATFSLDIPEKAIKILTYKGDIVLDPFMGSGTTAIACIKTERNYIGIELSLNYMEKANERINKFKEELLTNKI
jgi:DNA modification methylase